MWTAAARPAGAKTSLAPVVDGVLLVVCPGLTTLLVLNSHFLCVFSSRSNLLPRLWETECIRCGKIENICMIPVRQAVNLAKKAVRPIKGKL